MEKELISRDTDFFRLMHPGPDKFPVMKAERYEIRSHTCHALSLRTGTGPHEENRSRMPPSGQRLRLLREQRLRQAHACCRERSRARLPHGDALAAAFCSHAVCIGLRRGGCRQGNRVRQGGQCRQGHHRLLCGTHQPPHLFRTAGLGHHRDDAALLPGALRPRYGRMPAARSEHRPGLARTGKPGLRKPVHRAHASVHGRCRGRECIYHLPQRARQLCPEIPG